MRKIHINIQKYTFPPIKINLPLFQLSHLCILQNVCLYLNIIFITLQRFTAVIAPQSLSANIYSYDLPAKRVIPTNKKTIALLGYLKCLIGDLPNIKQQVVNCNLCFFWLLKQLEIFGYPGCSAVNQRRYTVIPRLIALAPKVYRYRNFFKI